MEKKFKVTKKTVLKNVKPETFITNEQWVKDNKRFAKFFIIEPIEEPIIEKEAEVEKFIDIRPQKKPVPKLEISKSENYEQIKQIDNE